MTKTVSDYIISRLHQWGVQRIYGYPGDGINGITGALQRAQERIAFIQVRHEESAAFMACGHAKFTGEPGICLATSGPGAIHLLNGLYDAKMDHQPVVALVGQQAMTALGGSYQQEVDLLSLFKDVAGEYVHMAVAPSQVRHLIDRAFRIAAAERTVTCIIIPNDLQEMDYEEPPREHGSLFSGVGSSSSIILPTRDELEKAAAILNNGKKVAMLIGAGALAATEEVMQVAEILGAGVAKALLGKAALPDELPYVTGSIGMLGTKPSWDLMMDSDTLLMVGTNFPYSEFLPKEGNARAVQIDIDAKMLGIRYPVAVPLHGDSKETLRALLPLLQRKEDRSWRADIEKGVEQWKKVLEKKAENEADPVNPQYVFAELSKRLPDNCILTADSGSTAVWFAQYLTIRDGMMASLSGGLSTMCPSVPYAIAAKFAHPDSVPIALSGDGAMQMLGINELITVAKYWRQWPDPRFIILVLNNKDLNMVSWEQRTAGNTKFEATQDLPDFHYAAYAKMLGLEGIKVERKEEVQDALDAAILAQKPVLVEVFTDPSVPLMPPHITWTQIKSFAAAIVKGDSNAWDMIQQTYKELMDEYFPGK